jgi:hypothetical protein
MRIPSQSFVHCYKFGDLPSFYLWTAGKMSHLAKPLSLQSPMTRRSNRPFSHLRGQMYQGPKAEGNLRRTFTRSTVHELCHIWASSTQGRGVYRQEGKCSVEVRHKDEKPTQKVSFDVIGLEMYSLFALQNGEHHERP